MKKWYLNIEYMIVVAATVYFTMTYVPWVAQKFAYLPAAAWIYSAICGGFGFLAVRAARRPWIVLLIVVPAFAALAMIFAQSLSAQDIRIILVLGAYAATFAIAAIIALIARPQQRVIANPTGLDAVPPDLRHKIPRHGTRT